MEKPIKKHRKIGFDCNHEFDTQETNSVEFIYSQLEKLTKQIEHKGEIK